MRCHPYFALIILLASSSCGAGSVNTPVDAKLQLPVGFHANVFAKLSGAPRMLAFDKNGHLFVTLKKSDEVVMLPDTNKDGVADSMLTVAAHLNNPNGLAFVNDDLLIANEDGVVKLTHASGKWSAPTPFISNLASGGHTLKTIKVGADNFLYLNVGSSCNVCVEDDATRATILRYTLEGQPAGGLAVVGRHTHLAPIWATGLRNAQGFAWHPKTGAMFATNNGSDNRSDIKNGKVNDDVPPEHLNKIEPGKNYGWPHCWGNPNLSKTMFEDPNFTGPENFCNNATPPVLTFISHSTPIGITFLDKSNFPAEYKSDAIVALHGSWNRKEASGYQLVRVKFIDNNPVEVIDFSQKFGRPTDVAVGADGALYVSDDKDGIIYRITYLKPQ